MVVPGEISPRQLFVYVNIQATRKIEQKTYPGSAVMMTYGIWWHLDEEMEKRSF
jgi:hypothetical protein